MEIVLRAQVLYGDEHPRFGAGALLGLLVVSA